ncbi:MAG: OmpA family protein [Alphaproteobacteria bacterium]
MRALGFLAMALAMAATAATAQEGTSVPIVGQTLALVFATQDLAGRTQDLASSTQALVFTIVDLGGKPQDIGGKPQDIGGKPQDLQVKETKTEIRIELAADVLFDFDKSSIRATAADALKHVAALIRDHPRSGVRIEGHTDGKGSDSYNQKLSEQRAKSVRDWLADKEGLKGVKFRTEGFGAKRPVAPNAKPDGSDDPDGRQKNRRVEIVIEKG